MSKTNYNGIIRIPANQSVDDTVAKLEGILQAKGITLFAIVDHSGGAARAGMQMPNTKLVIFGNPRAGTPVMLGSPSIAIDLPLKILVAEDLAGKVWVSFNSPQWLAARHGVPTELVKALTAVEGLAVALAE